MEKDSPAMWSMRSLTAVLLVPVWLAACGDPLAGVDKLSEVELAEDAPRSDLVVDEANVTEPVARPGLLAGMFGAAQDKAPAPVTGQNADTADTEPALPVAETEAEPEAEAPKPRGFLGLFSRDDTQNAEPPKAPSVQVAALPRAEPENGAQAEKPPRRGLFGGAGAKSGAKKPPSVPAGTLLSFGVVKPVCDLPRAKRGKETHAFPERGKRWRLYDSAPGKTTPHPFYVTGFDDGCARTFTAAVAVFGAPAMHELLRYGLPAKVQPYSATDQAYEKIKSRVCKVARRKPCGAKVSKLEKNTVFVSAYENYGSNGRWFNMLLHDGEVEATDIKSGG